MIGRSFYNIHISVWVDLLVRELAVAAMMIDMRTEGPVRWAAA